MSNLPNPTSQGLDIIETWTGTSSSLMISAYAGCGKTTLLQQLSPHITERSVLALAFNKKNALDLAAKMPPHFDVSTLNSVGHRALGSAIRKRLFVESTKTSKIIKSVGETLGLGRVDEETWNSVSTLVRNCKAYGLMPSKFSNFKSLLPDTRDTWEELCDRNMIDFNPDVVGFAREVLIESINQALAGTIDYDDQIYISTLVVGAYQKYQVVIVDEAQDLSALNHLQLRKSLLLSGRLIVVGDPKQAIYAFRGASSKSMGEVEALRPEGTFSHLPLSLTFRCSKVVVERNQDHAPGFEADERNRAGSVLDLRHKLWSLDQFPSGRLAILCRNNAPLLAAAFRIIKQGKGVTMLGRDIGKNLSALLLKVCGKDKDLALEACIEKVLEWKRKELDLARLNGKEEKLALIEDRADSLLAVAEGCDGETLADIDAAIKNLFEDQSGLITLGTGHRAKGLEWETVIHLDPFRIPSKHAKKAEERGDPAPMEQELNLKYVIETRTQDVLVLANLEDFEG